jgi:type IV secretory pathway VirB2 component (pilin)
MVIHSTIRRYLPLVVTLGLLLALSTVGVSAQTPIESAAQRLVDIFIRIAPLLAAIAFIVGGILLAVGHHDAYPRLVNICFGVAVALGAVTLVNYFR